MTEELKAMLKAAKTEEEAKEILLANKSELTEEEIEKINGGDMAEILGVSQTQGYLCSCYVICDSAKQNKN